MAKQRYEQFIKEVEKKIGLVRINRFVKDYEDSLTSRYRPPPEPSFQTTKLVEEVRAMRKEIREARMETDRLKKELDEKPPIEVVYVPDSVEMSVMYPVPTEVKSLLYNGLSTDREGRYSYLKARRELEPKEKYRKLPTQNCIYGWEPFVIKKPTNGRVNVLKTAMYSIHRFTLYHKHPTNRALLPHPSLNGEMEPPIY